jgi:hypothetical protein
MSTPLTNAASRARAFDFLLPTFSSGDALVSFRPDPSTNNVTKGVPSFIFHNAVPGSRIAQINRDGSGTTVLGGWTMDASGKLVAADAVALKVERRPELIPADQVPGGAPAPNNVSGQQKTGGATPGVAQRKVAPFLDRLKTAAQSGPGKAWIVSAVFAGGLLLLIWKWK